MNSCTLDLESPSLNSITLSAVKSLELTDATGSGAPLIHMAVRVTASQVTGESL